MKNFFLMQFDSIARKTYTNQISACFVLCLIYSHFLLRYDYLISRTQPYARSIFFSFNVSNCNVFVLFLFICHCYFRSNLVLSTAFSIIIILFNNLFICCCCCFCRVFFFSFTFLLQFPIHVHSREFSEYLLQRVASCSQRNM